jgi:CHAD domain-containing protein
MALRAAASQIETNARGALASDDPEYLHQLRVGLRRLRSALRAFRGISHKKQAKRLRRALRKLAPELGPARDWDVLVQRLESAGAAPKLRARARRERAKAREAARRAIESKKFARVMAALRGMTAQETTRGLAPFAARALDRAHGKLLAHVAGGWDDAEERYAVRIRVKRLRYSCEFFAFAFPDPRTRDYVAALKELQATLGALNDIAVGRQLIGFEEDEAPLIEKLDAAWQAFAKRPPFWRAPGERPRRAATRSRSPERPARAPSGFRPPRKRGARRASGTARTP